MAILLNGWILPIGGASAAKGLRLQPAQLACFFKSSWQIVDGLLEGVELAWGQCYMTMACDYFV